MSDTDWYCEIIDVREGTAGSRTGLGAEWDGEVAARVAFASIPEAKRRRVAFLVDLHHGHDLVDTRCIDVGTFRALVGSTPESVETYARRDRRWWQSAIQARKLGGVHAD